MLIAGLLNSEYSGLDPRVKATCLEDRNQLEIIQFAMVLEHLYR